MEKTCFKCGTPKPLTDFYRHPQMGDGHLGKCKECTKVDSSMRDPEKVRAYDRARAKEPHRKSQFLEAQRRRRAANPLKNAAHCKVARALKSGKLVKAPLCEVCLSVPPSVGHHEDYAKPLSVVWLCESCHKRAHLKPLPF